MDTVKMIRNTYGGTEYLRKATQYPYKEDLRGYGGYGVNPNDPELAYKQMLAVKSYFGKTEGNPLIHYVVSYDENITNAKAACEMTAQICRYFENEYQVLQAVHEKDHDFSQYHAHIILNSVNYINGLMYHSDIGEMNRFRNYVQQVTGQPAKLYIKNAGAK